MLQFTVCHQNTQIGQQLGIGQMHILQGCGIWPNLTKQIIELRTAK